MAHATPCGEMCIRDSYERMKNRDLAGAQKMIREHIERQQESIMQTVHHQSMTGVEEK